jgi:hypothetical protein
MQGKPKWSWRSRDLRDGGVAEVVQGMLERDPERRWTVSCYAFDEADPD